MLGRAQKKRSGHSDWSPFWSGLLWGVGQSPGTRKIFTKRLALRKKQQQQQTTHPPTHPPPPPRPHPHTHPYSVSRVSLRPHSLSTASRGGGVPEAAAPGDAPALGAAGRRSRCADSRQLRRGPSVASAELKCSPVFRQPQGAGGFRARPGCGKTWSGP